MMDIGQLVCSGQHRVCQSQTSVSCQAMVSVKYVPLINFGQCKVCQCSTLASSNAMVSAASVNEQHWSVVIHGQHGVWVSDGHWSAGSV